VFASFAAITLVLVSLLGLALVNGFRAEAEARGLAQGTEQAVLVAQTAIEPRLDARPLSEGLSPSESADMRTLATSAVRDGRLLRLRLRDMAGNVVFSDDGSGFNGAVEDEVVSAARGRTVSLITRINSDANDNGAIGQQAVEVYLPLMGGRPRQQVGVLEMYLPYEPIASDIRTGLDRIYRLLGMALLVLYAALSVIAWSITRRPRRQLRINTYLAEHDALTGLANRSVFQRRLDEILADPEMTARGLAVAIVDLDRFKVLDDTLGHRYGDALLLRMAQRLSSRASDNVVVARLGGDEFGILVVGDARPETELQIIKAHLEREVSVAWLPPVSMSCSVGYAVAPGDGADGETLLRRAEVAMYHAKVERLGLVRYDAGNDRYDEARISLVGEVRRAIDCNELFLAYQPKVRLRDRQPVAVEALVRWNHPTLGLLSPDAFIPLVEQTDLIHDFTAWAISRALSDMEHLGPVAEGLGVAINVSARNLALPDFTERVTRAVAASSIAADRVVLEITETELLANPKRAVQVLNAISASGIRVSLDDFGVGQTSLSHVAALPISELKIDKTFVTDMVENPVHRVIVQSIVDLAQSLDMLSIAEGVETREQAEALRLLGCEFAQGYLFSQPLALDALGRWLRERMLVGALAEERLQ